MMKAPKTLESVTFTVKGQIVIPQWVREEFDIEAGTRAVVCPTKDGILLKPITPKYIKSLRGSLRNSQAMKTFKAARRQERGS